MFKKYRWTHGMRINGCSIMSNSNGSMSKTTTPPNIQARNRWANWKLCWSSTSNSLSRFVSKSEFKSTSMRAAMQHWTKLFNILHFSRAHSLVENSRKDPCLEEECPEHHGLYSSKAKGRAYPAPQFVELMWSFPEWYKIYNGFSTAKKVGAPHLDLRRSPFKFSNFWQFIVCVV